jgi:hypothetical protein
MSTSHLALIVLKIGSKGDVIVARVVSPSVILVNENNGV